MIGNYGYPTSFSLWLIMTQCDIITHYSEVKYSMKYEFLISLQKYWSLNSRVIIISI